MNPARRKKVVLLGMMSKIPVAGAIWGTMQYLIGFERLGLEAYYVEAHARTPSMLMERDDDDSSAMAAAFISGVMNRFDLGGRWAFHALHDDGRCYGMSETQLKELYASADLLINYHGGTVPLPEHSATGRLVYLETDPVELEIELYNNDPKAIEFLEPHVAFFTWGLNYGNPDCKVPLPERFHFQPLPPAVVPDLWESQPNGACLDFTTVGNWRQSGMVRYRGDDYSWSKHHEFLKFIDLPRRTRQTFELALSSYEEGDRALLESNGWKIREGLSVSSDLDTYRNYIAASRGEFTVAKDQNVRLRSGWFSERSAQYLASGRPVITQETGFSNILPTGAGLFAFSGMDEILTAVEEVKADGERQRRAARDIARDCFSHEVVLGRMLRDLGLSRPEAQRSGSAKASALPQDFNSALPPSLTIAPVGRWPTRLPEETMAVASSLPVPIAPRGAPTRGRRASIVIVTFNGLCFVKMCLTALLANGWRSGDELIIVDNASSDGTPDFLRELERLNPFVRIIFNDRNRGFAGASNQGLAIASGEVLVLLNSDTLTPNAWLDGLVRWLDNPDIGLIGPVTNRTCNEAQIDAPYRTFGEMEQFARTYTREHRFQSGDIPMLAMFCLAMRRDVFRRLGPLDEQFEVGMFEDDDYARRAREAGLRIVCAEDAFVHHFGQASLGELCTTGDYDRILEANRLRFETKWGIRWQPHGRRITEEYRKLRQRICDTVTASLPAGATILVVSKGDEELLKLDGRCGWHFPQAHDGQYLNIYPASSAEAIEMLESLRARGAGFLLFPKPAFWWLDYYGGLKEHLERFYPRAVSEEGTCLIFDLGGTHA